MRDKNGWTGAPRFLFQPVKGGFRILQELTLFGEIDRVQTAIDRLRMLAPNAEANHPGGLMVCDSGGKDSDVIKELARLAGVRFEIAHSHTTADHPLTVRYVREEQARWRALGVSYTIIYPTFKGKSTSMWALIPIKGAPMRQRRWCCDLLKETAGAGRYTVTGVRWAESANRKQRRATYELPSGKRERIKLNNDNDLKRRMTEFCMKRGKVVVNPIIDWQDADVWEFHDLYHLPHNPLVDIEQKKAEGKGRGYERWATMHNLKQMAATLNVYQEYGFTSPEQLEAAVDTAYQEMRQTSGELKALETKLQGKKELQRQVLAYAKTKPVRDGLKAQKSPKAREAYRQAHESDFIIADAAARYFKAHGITRLPARKALQDEIEQLVSKKSGLYNTYHAQKQRFKELQTVKRNIDQILRREEPRRRKEQSHER